MELFNIIDAIQANRIRITDHADEEAESDQLTFDEIYFSVFMEKLLKIIQMTSHTRAAWFMVKLLAAIPFILFGLLMMRTNGLFLSRFIAQILIFGLIFE